MRPTLSAEENARRLVAYKSTANDADASKVLGLNGATFRLWRNAHGLPAKATGKPKGRHGSRKPAKLQKSDVALVADLLKAEKAERMRPFIPR